MLEATAINLNLSESKDIWSYPSVTFGENKETNVFQGEF